MAADALDARIGHLEGALEQIDQRLGSLERKVEDGFAQLRAELAQLRTDGNATRSELVSRMDRQFFWILSLLLISVLMPIALRLTSR